MMPATTQGTVKLVADLVKMVEKWLLSMPEEYVGRFIPFFIIAAALSITAEAVAGTCRSLSRSHLPVHTVNAHGTQKKTHIALCLEGEPPRPSDALAVGQTMGEARLSRPSDALAVGQTMDEVRQTRSAPKTPPKAASGSSEAPISAQSSRAGGKLRKTSSAALATVAKPSAQEPGGQLNRQKHRAAVPPAAAYRQAEEGQRKADALATATAKADAKAAKENAAYAEATANACLEKDLREQAELRILGLESDFRAAKLKEAAAERSTKLLLERADAGAAAAEAALNSALTRASVAEKQAADIKASRDLPAMLEGFRKRLRENAQKTILEEHASSKIRFDRDLAQRQASHRGVLDVKEFELFDARSALGAEKAVVEELRDQCNEHRMSLARVEQPMKRALAAAQADLQVTHATLATVSLTLLVVRGAICDGVSMRRRSSP
jgi:hypothetical protein